MKCISSLRMLAWLAIAVVIGAGCGTVGNAGVEAAAAARANAQHDWRMQLDWTGGMTDIALERMDIYLGR